MINCCCCVGQIKQDLRRLLNWSDQNNIIISLDQEGTQLLNDEVKHQWPLHSHYTM